MTLTPLAIAFTPDYFVPAATMLRSLLDASTGDFEIICLVTEEIPERMQEKLEAISQLSEYLQSIDYEVPDNVADREFYSVMNPDYLHRKVVYDYFNLVIKFLPLSKLYYLKYCRLATPFDKMMMILRWIKQSYFQTFLSLSPFTM